MSSYAQFTYKVDDIVDMNKILQRSTWEHQFT